MRYKHLIRKSVFSSAYFVAYLFVIFSIFFSSVSEAKELPATIPGGTHVTLQLKWIHQFQFAGYYAAQHKGFYAKEGLNVTIKTGSPDVSVDEEVTSGRADYGVLASELIQKKALGKPLVLLAVIMQHSTRAIIVRADSGINSPDTLIGRQMMLNQNEDTEFMAMFAAEGIAIDRLSITPKDKTANNKFINGEIDALNGSIGNQPFLFQNKGIPVNTIRPINYGVDFYGDSLFTSETELKKHPNRVKAFRKATLEGWAYAMAHPREIIDLIITEYNSEKSVAHLQFEANVMRKLILPGLVSIGHVNPHRIERIAQTYADRNIIQKNFSLKGFIYNPSSDSDSDSELVIQLIAWLSSIIFLSLILTWSLRRVIKRQTKDLLLANEELQLSEKILNKAQEIAHIGSWHLDLKKDVLTWSDETYRICGLTPQEFGATYDAFLKTIHPDDVEMVNRAYTSAVENNTHYENVHRVIRPDGNVRVVHVKSEDIVDEKGETTHSFGTTHDITEHVEDEAKYKNIIEISIDGFWVVDTKGAFLEVNESYCKMIGYSHDELLGMSIMSVEAIQSPEEIEKRIQDIITNGSGRFETRHRRKDGDIIDLEVSTIYSPNNTGMFFVFLRDITERKKAEVEKKNLETRLSQAQKMEAIGTLAGGIAHDFNNILATIFGYTELAKEGVSSGTQLEKYLEQVLIGANRAKYLVKQILAFSRQAQVERIPMKIQPLIKEGLKMLRSSIPSTIHIIEDIDFQSGTILADPTQVHQILINLCTNACQAMDGTGGTLAVSFQTKDIGLDEQNTLDINPGKYAELTVSDTGGGIGVDVIDKIFDPYFTTKDVGKGSGMGLSIIHGIIKGYSGAITVESELGKGSNFHVFFPIIKEDAIPQMPETDKTPGGKERILFIDDEKLLAELGQATLEKLGYHVTVRCSSLDALITFKNSPNEFDIVITDQTMPDMTGSDLARQMLQVRPDIPIILCTGYSNLIDEHSAKNIGIKEFALKPLTKRMIGELIRKVLDAK
jgi:PAS domain S-box-containing protein